MAQLHPYLSFNGNCRDAMTFYQNCLGGELHIQTFGEAPTAGQAPDEPQNNIMHSQLTAGNITLMAADMGDPSQPLQGGAVHLTLVSEDKDEIRGYFDKLAEGGTIRQSLKEEFFGLFGSLTDKFGINWMFQAGNMPQE